MFLSSKKVKGHTYWYVLNKKRVAGQSRSFIVERLGEEASLLAKDPDFLKRKETEITKLNEDLKAEKASVTKILNPAKKATARTMHAGAFPIFAAMSDIGLYDVLNDSLGEKIGGSYPARIVSDLISQRIISPGSKLSSYGKTADNSLTGGADYSLDSVYRSLDRLGDSMDSIQSKMCSRKKAEDISVVYYDTTNFYFEIEEPDEKGLRQYGISKEHRPNPIVQMGLFMDGEGNPLFCNVNPGNTAECNTVLPTAKEMSAAGISNYIYCADAGIGAGKIKVFNDSQARRYVIAQSLKKLDNASAEWALNDGDWNCGYGSKAKHGLKKEDCPKGGFLWKETVRKLVINYETGEGRKAKREIAERLIVTYSKDSYQWETHKLDGKIKRALAASRTSAESNPNSISSIMTTVVVNEDAEELQDVTLVRELDQNKVEEEKKFHGYYAVVTNLPPKVDASSVLAVNARRFQIERYFREMKSTVSTRPIYVRKDTHIKGHILICYLAVMLLMEMNARLKEKDIDCSPEQLRETIEGMLLKELYGLGYEPCHVGREEHARIREALEKCYGMENLEMEYIPTSKIKRYRKILEGKVSTTEK